MAWIQSHQSLDRHGKTLMLTHILGIPRHQVVGHLHALWWWAVDSCGESGDLSKYSAAAIADAAGWIDFINWCSLIQRDYPTEANKTRSSDFVMALIDCGFIEYSGEKPSEFDPIGGGARIHDWAFFTERYFSSLRSAEALRDGNRRRQEAYKARHITTNGQVTGRANVIVTSLREDKIRKEKKRVGGMGGLTPPKPPSTRAFVPPDHDQVKAYCQERGAVVDPELWLAHYQANGWRVGKNPMKDWRAAIRTWERNGIEPQAAPGCPRTAPGCCCGVTGAKPQVKARDGKTMVCRNCREREDIQAGVL